MADSITVLRGTTDGSGFELANVPEPSTYAELAPVLLFGSAFLLRRRRRA